MRELQGAKLFKSVTIKFHHNKYITTTKRYKSDCASKTEKELR